MFSGYVLFFSIAAWCQISVYVHHTVFDRALQSPLKRMSQQRSELLYDSQAQGDEPKESNLGYLLEWFVGTGCGAHDIQKSLT